MKKYAAAILLSLAVGGAQAGVFGVAKHFGTDVGNVVVYQAPFCSGPGTRRLRLHSSA